MATFILEGVTDLELSDFNHQNVIYGLSIKKHPDFYELILEHCWGLSGRVQARRLRIEFEVGKPKKEDKRG